MKLLVEIVAGTILMWALARLLRPSRATAKKIGEAEDHLRHTMSGWTAEALRSGSNVDNKHTVFAH
jgi:hypothetical protein